MSILEPPPPGVTPPTFRDVARREWGSNYSEQFDAEATILERGGCTAEDAEIASEMVDNNYRVRDEWAYFRTVSLARAATRLVTLRRAGMAD